MNLDFGILWIEDSFSSQEELELKRRVSEAGFIARINVIPNGYGIDGIARDNQLYHCYDLILLDYKLDGEFGDNLAEKIRNLFPTTTILFYSASSDEAGLRQKIADKAVEGVYCSVRTRFIERAGSLIDQTVYALNRLSGMRGLAMKVVAECDDLMKKAILSMANRDTVCAEKVNKLDKDVFEFIGLLEKNYKAAVLADLDARLADRAVDSAKLFKHFRRLTKVVVDNPTAFGLNKEQADRLSELRLNSRLYVEMVLTKRNELGHVTEVKGDTGWVLEGSNSVTVGDFPEIRQVFARHVDSIREINGLVVTLGE